jgi:hypothetical protein
MLGKIFRRSLVKLWTQRLDGRLHGLLSPLNEVWPIISIQYSQIPGIYGKSNEH